MKTDASFNPNAPEIVLGDWLQKMSASIVNLSFVVNDYDETKCALLAIILEFADRQNKLCEMYHWLTSLEGNELLSREEYQVAGNMIKGELFMFDNDVDDEIGYPDNQLIGKLRNFIEDHFVTTDHRLHLRA